MPGAIVAAEAAGAAVPILPKHTYHPGRGLLDHGLRVDEEFRHLIPPLSAAERDGLERQLRADGRCLSPLLVWRGHGIILDGHNRLEICLKWHLRFAVEEIDLPDREAAKDWILAHQADQRNLVGLGRSWLRGLRYELEKNRRGGTGANQHCREQMSHDDTSAEPTAERLARVYKVSVATIMRDRQLAAAVQRLGAKWGARVRQLLLSPDSRCTWLGVTRLDELAGEEQQQAVADLLETGKLKLGRRGQRGPAKMTVPRAPVLLAHELIRRLSPEDLQETYQQLATHMEPPAEERKEGRC